VVCLHWDVYSQLLVGGNISHILDTTTLDVSHEQKFMTFYGDIQGGPFKYVYLAGLVVIVEVWYSGRREFMEFSEVFIMMAPRVISGLLWPVCCSLLVFSLAACSSGSSHSTLSTPPRPTQVATTQVLGTEAVSPADSNRCINAALGRNVQGMNTNVTVGATIESSTGLPILAKHDVKIIWDMAGTGPFYVFGLGPRGIRLLPFQGPLVHLTANGTGAEWGTLFNFPVAGCWDLHAMRDHAFGDLWLDVL
jgi:hypothetical protein